MSAAEHPTSERRARDDIIAMTMTAMSCGLHPLMLLRRILAYSSVVQCYEKPIETAVTRKA
jgi:hypothetical protein